MHRERRAVLRGIAALTGVAVGSGTGIAAGRGTGVAVGSGTGDAVRRQVAADLQPGVTLFDLDGDGEFAVTVEPAPEGVRDDDHPEPIRITSGGRSTVDYAVAVVEPPGGTTLGGLDELSYDYYRGSDDASTSTADGGTGETTADADAGLAPGDTFLVVENADGRHGMYLAPDGDVPEDAGTDRSAEQWRTFDVFARMGGRAGGGDSDDAAGGDAAGGDSGDTGTTGDGNWIEYTTVEEGYEGESFDDVFDRFGADARLVRVGVGHGDPVAPTVLDASYDSLALDGEVRRFPTSVVNRVS